MSVHSLIEPAPGQNTAFIDNDAVLRRSIRIHLPNEDDWRMACRVAIAVMRDQASAGMRRCSDAAYPLLAYVAREATTAVYAQLSTRQLVLIRSGLTTAMDAARIMERASK